MYEEVTEPRCDVQTERHGPVGAASATCGEAADRAEDGIFPAASCAFCARSATFVFSSSPMPMSAVLATSLTLCTKTQSHFEGHTLLKAMNYTSLWKACFLRQHVSAIRHRSTVRDAHSSRPWVSHHYVRFFSIFHRRWIVAIHSFYQMRRPRA